MSSPIAPIAQAIAEGFKLIKTVLDTAEVRKMKACIEAGEKYIFVNEKQGEYETLPDVKQDKYLKHYRKRFFRFNQ